jgi:predicted ABC-type ATPase
MAIVAAHPILFVIAGPNGAGKSTFHDTVLAGRIAAPFVNADLIQRDELGDLSPKASYKAAEIADERRREFLKEGRSFVMETVFSHPSKLDLLRDARAAGFRIVVYHLNLASADLAVARVKARKAEGGHDVPEDKIRQRFERNRKLIRQAALLADRAQIFDSSALNEPPRVLMELTNGQVVSRAERRPEWFERLYGDLG